MTMQDSAPTKRDNVSAVDHLLINELMDILAPEVKAAEPAVGIPLGPRWLARMCLTQLVTELNAKLTDRKPPGHATAGPTRHGRRGRRTPVP